jgi:hypothetical protein
VTVPFRFGEDDAGAMAPAPRTAPAPAQPVRGPSRVIPGSFYHRYLKSQMVSIRERGGTEDDLNQFLDAEQRTPMARLASMPLGEVDPVNVPGHFQGLSMAVVQGATFGWGDEAVGALLGALSDDATVQESIAAYRAEYDAYKGANSTLAGGAEIAGGIGGMMLSGGAAAGGGIARALVAGAKAGAAMGAGNADPAEDWTLEALGARTKGALLGGAAGAAVGGGLASLGKVAAPIASAIGRHATESGLFRGAAGMARSMSEAVGGANPADKAARAAAGRRVAPAIIRPLVERTPEGRGIERILAHMERAGISPERLAANAEAQWSLGLRPTLVDAMDDDAFTAFASTVFAERTGPARAAIAGLEARQMQMPEQLTRQLLVRSLDNPQLGMGNILRAEHVLHARGKVRSAPLYREAHEQVVQLTPDMRRLLRRPDIMEAWNAGASTANKRIAAGVDTGLEVPTLTPAMLRPRGARGTPPAGFQPTALAGAPPAPAPLTELPVRGVDYMQRRLKVGLKRLYKEGKIDRDAFDQELEAVREFARPIVAEAERQVPSFAKARAIYSESVQSRLASRRGYKRFGGGDPDALAAGGRGVTSARGWLSIQDDIARLKRDAPADVDYYRLGAARALYERSLTGEGLDAAKLFGGGRLTLDPATGVPVGASLGIEARRIAALFPDNPDRAQDFLRLVAGEASLTKTFRGAVRLPKAINPERLEEAAAGPIAQVRSGFASTLFSAGRNLVQQSRAQHSAEEGKALAQLFAHGLNDPDDLRVLLDEIAFQAARRQSGVRGSLARRLRTTVAGQAGRALEAAF